MAHLQESTSLVRRLVRSSETGTVGVPHRKPWFSWCTSVHVTSMTGKSQSLRQRVIGSLASRFPRVSRTASAPSAGRHDRGQGRFLLPLDGAGSYGSKGWRHGANVANCNHSSAWSTRPQGHRSPPGACQPNTSTASECHYRKPRSREPDVTESRRPKVHLHVGQAARGSSGTHPPLNTQSMPSGSGCGAVPGQHRRREPTHVATAGTSTAS
jgi:hypothetical protein